MADPVADIAAAAAQRALADYQAANDGSFADEMQAANERRMALINSLFAQRDGPATAEPYWDPVRPLVVGFRVGMPQTLGDTLGGLGAPLRWIDSAVSGEEEGWLTSLAKVLESGGDWVAEHPWVNEEAVARLRATVANPIIDDDGKPIWDPASWVTDREGQFDLHRRIVQSAATLGGNIGTSALPFLAELGLTRGVGRIASMSKLGTTALGIGAMSSVTARQQYRDLVAEGVSPDIAGREATLYGSIAGPIEYAEQILNTKLFKAGIGALPGGKTATGMFEFVATKILGEGGRFATLRGMAGEGAEEVAQGFLTNPSRQRAFDAMRQRDPNWNPAVGDWYTLNDAYNDFAIGAMAGGFIRTTGKLWHAATTSRKTAELEAKGEDSKSMRPDQIDAVSSGASTANNADVDFNVEAHLKSTLSTLAKGGDASRLGDIGADDVVVAAALYNEDRQAGLDFWESRTNQKVVRTEDGVVPSNKDITEAATARRDAVANDDSKARAFMQDQSAADRPPLGTPVVAIPAENASAHTRPIDFEKLDSDEAVMTYLGIPVRTNLELLPTERSAMAAFREEMSQIRSLAPDARVTRQVFSVVSMTEAQAKTKGIDPRNGRDAQGNVVTRLNGSVAFKAGKPEIRLPRDFTLRDLRQAKTQLLLTKNESAPAKGDWNQGVDDAMGMVDEWWKRVQKAVGQAAAMDRGIAPEDLQAPDKAATALLGRANALMASATASQAAAEMPRLRAIMTTLQGSQLDSGAVQAYQKQLDNVAMGIQETSESTKARRLMAAMSASKNRPAAVASLFARPDTIPDSGRMTPQEIGQIGAVWNQQTGSVGGAEVGFEITDALQNELSERLDKEGRADIVQEPEAQAAVEEQAAKSETAQAVEETRRLAEALEAEPEIERRDAGYVFGDQRDQRGGTQAPISKAELDSRLAEVARRMNGAITENPDGTKTLRIGNVEMVVENVSDLDGANGVNIRIRDTAMAGKIVGYRLRFSDSANATTAAHEVLHAALDMLDSSERKLLAAELGRTELDVETDEAITQDLAEGIVAGREYGTAGSLASIAWQRVKTAADALFHLRFGEAWEALRSLPDALRADGVRRLLTTGEVFEREASAERIGPDIRYQRNARQELDRSLGITGRTKSASQSAGRMLLAYQDRVVEEVAKLAELKQVTELEHAEAVQAGKEKLAEFKEGVKQIVRIEKAIAKASQFVRTKIDDRTLPMFEAADVAADAVYDTLARKELAGRLEATRTAVLNMMRSLGMDAGRSSKLYGYVSGMSITQLRAVTNGISSSVNTALLARYRRDAAEVMADVRKLTSKSMWADKGIAEKGAELTDNYNANKKSRDWRDAKSLAETAEALVEDNVARVKQQAEEQKSAERSMSKDMRDELTENVDKNPEIAATWHRAAVDFLAQMSSVFRRMGGKAYDIFYNRIQKASQRQSATERAALKEFIKGVRDAGWTTDEQLRDAATKKRVFRMPGGDVEMTPWQAVHHLSMLTDPDTLARIRSGRPVMDEEMREESPFSEGRNPVYHPAGGAVTWINKKTAEMYDGKRTSSPGKDWYSPEIEDRIMAFVAQTTTAERKIAGMSKHAMLPAIAAVNEKWAREHDGNPKFKEDWLPHEDPALAAFLGLPADTVFGYSPRAADMQVAGETFETGAELKRLNLEETGFLGARTTELKAPLLAQNFEVAFTHRVSQMTRWAYLQEPIRKAVDMLTDSAGAGANSFKDKFVKTYGKEALDDVLMYLNRAAGFGYRVPVLPWFDALARNVMIGRLAYRPTTWLSNRYASVPVFRGLLNQLGEQLGLGGIGDTFVKMSLGRIDLKSEAYSKALAELQDDDLTGYFYKRWNNNMFRAYTQTDLTTPSAVTEWNLKMAGWQNMAMDVLANAEKKIAVAAYQALRESGMDQHQAVHQVELLFRKGQNPSDSLDESAALRRVKQANWGWLFPFIGQTMATRNLLADALLGLKDPAQAKAAQGMIAAIGVTLVASEGFRAIMRKIVRGPDEDEEEKRRRRTAMNLVRDAMGTVAPGIGDGVLGYLIGDRADAGLFAESLADAMALPALGVKALTADATSPEIEAKQIVDAARKSMIAVSTAIGMPTSGGVDQLSEALMERLIPPTKQEVSKRRAVEVMDSLSSKPTKAEFTRATRLAYKEAVAEKRIDPKKVSYSQFRNRFRSRAVKKFGEDHAKRLGFEIEKD